VYTIFKPELVTLQSGNLVLKSYPNDHTGSEYSGRKLISYGKYRASIKLDQSSGTYLTFYSYMWPTGANRDGHNEIDVELIRNGGSTTASFTNHLNGVCTANHYTLPFDPSQAYHVYGYNYYPNKIEYVIDDKIIWTSTTNIPNKPMYVYFQNFVMKNLPSDHKSVSTEYVDWVTVEPL
jgi:beta-glucanase (GH16 family)